MAAASGNKLYTCADKGRPQYDFSDEKDYFVTAPHRGDLGTNLVLGATLLWLPLTIASVARAAFVKYRFTNLRLSVTTKAGPLRGVLHALPSIELTWTVTNMCLGCH